MISPDLRARRLLMSSHLYYDRDSPVLGDAEFDALCREVALDIENEELLGIGALSDLRLLMLGSADAVRASTFHVQISRATVAGAEHWHEHVIGEKLNDFYVFRGVWSEEHQLDLATLQ